jgi:tRNA G18 (ribose-2'-O)-methylase SpoU
MADKTTTPILNSLLIFTNRFNWLKIKAKDSYFCPMQKIKNADLGRKSVDEFKRSEKLPVILVLDNVRSLNNVGSAFRIADSFLLENLYLCGLTGHPPNAEIEKTALGATETVNWKHFKTTEEAIDDLKQKDYKIYAVEQVKNSIYLQNFKPIKNEKIALVFGSEVYGVEQDVIDICDGSIEIPQLGMKHSLNISVSIGIVVWEVVKRYLL